ncbi:MAG: winged helix-turn-helix transcriptional regulator [Promethearchaeota archaeon]
MQQIDLKDRKILYHLDLNCRQSNSQIGKKVGLSKQVVDYRIKKMEEEGLICGYWAAINTFALGYQVYRIYINYQDVTSDIKKKIIKDFMDYKYTWVLASIRSPIDLDIVLWVKNVYNFDIFWDNILKKYNKYFSKYHISIYTKSTDYKKSYLLKENLIETNRKFFDIRCDGSFVQIDDIDYKILNEIVINARIPIKNIANKFKVSSQTINYRIKNLIKCDIIKAFRVDIDYSKIGLHCYKLDIYLRDYSKRNEIIKYLEKQPYFIILNTAIGWADIEPEIVLKNADELFKIIEEIDLKFPNVIRKQEYWIAEKEYKFRWLPEMTEADFK